MTDKGIEKITRDLERFTGCHKGKEIYPPLDFAAAHQDDLDKVIMDIAKVRSRYPKACSEMDYPNTWSIWDINRDERESLSEKYWYRYRSRMLLGLGSTEDEAWANAVREIEWREGRKLPIRKIL